MVANSAGVSAGLLVASPKVKIIESPASFTLLPPVSEATTLVRTGPVVSAVIEAVVAAVTVGELAEVTTPSVARLTVILSAGAASLQDAAVERATKKVVEAAKELSAATGMVVTLPILTAV